MTQKVKLLGYPSRYVTVTKHFLDKLQVVRLQAGMHVCSEVVTGGRHAQGVLQGSDGEDERS